MVNSLQAAFPGLARGGYTITSPSNKDYNCIAWAAGDAENWWWPVSPDIKEVFWPAAVPRAETISAFRAAFAALDYIECGGEDLEPGFEKIALFADDQGIPPANGPTLVGRANWVSEKILSTSCAIWRARYTESSCCS